PAPVIQPPKKEDAQQRQHQGKFHRGGPLWSPPNLWPAIRTVQDEGRAPENSGPGLPRIGGEEGQGRLFAAFPILPLPQSGSPRGELVQIG
ncbi:MAG TPA: hypothetical protein VIN67_01065, partial [Desulfobaccales bacterium]